MNQKFFMNKVDAKARFFNRRKRALSPIKSLAAKIRLLSPENTRIVRKIVKRDTPSSTVGSPKQKKISNESVQRIYTEWTMEQVNLIQKLEKKVKIAKASRFAGFTSPSVLQRRLEFETSANLFDRNESMGSEVKSNTRTIKRRSRVFSEESRNAELNNLSLFSL